MALLRGRCITPDTIIAFDEQPLWQWAVLTVGERRGLSVLRLLSEDAVYSQHVNALTAKAKEGGPALLAAWHRDRRTDVLLGIDDAEAESGKRT